MHDREASPSQCDCGVRNVTHSGVQGPVAASRERCGCPDEVCKERKAIPSLSEDPRHRNAKGLHCLHPPRAPAGATGEASTETHST